jgi:hypothetical protein
MSMPGGPETMRKLLMDCSESGDVNCEAAKEALRTKFGPALRASFPFYHPLNGLAPNPQVESGLQIAWGKLFENLDIDDVPNLPYSELKEIWQAGKEGDGPKALFNPEKCLMTFLEKANNELPYPTEETNGPPQTRIDAEDGQEYTQQQFQQFYGDGWEAKWNKSPTRRWTDAHGYSMQEMGDGSEEYYNGNEWVRWEA